MLDAILRSHAETIPDAAAIRVLRDGAYRTWSYAEVWRLACSVASILRSRGINPGDRVALFADNSPEWVFAYLGIFLSGAVVFPLDAQYTELELGTILNFAGCKMMLCSEAKRSLAEGRTPETVTIDGKAAIFDAPSLEPLVPRRPEELMTVIFTSGTTGEPKGVCLTVGNISANVDSMRRLGLVKPTDVFLSLLPLHHAYALTTTILVPLTCGISITMCTSLQGPDILAAMRDTGVSLVPGVPRLFEGFDRAIADKIQRSSPMRRRMFRILLAISHGTRKLTGWSPGKILFRPIHQTFGPQFRFFVSGGAKLNADISKRFLDMGINIAEGYGLTETSPVVSLNMPDRIRPGTVGTPLPDVQVRIDQPDTEGIGEICVRGPNVMIGYDRRPDETAAVLRDGWFLTGDLGFIDGEGYIHITGRMKEVIVLASGKNIYPEDVERHYEKSPLIREIAIIPVELADGRVEKLCALVVPDFEELRRLRTASTYDTIHKEITRMSQHLPTYMRVTDLKIITNELPRTRLGKLRRAEIRKMALTEIQETTAILTPHDQTLLAAPGADWVISRIRTLSGHKGEIHPSDNLELDLGVDSLTRIELLVALEQDSGVKIPPEDAADIHTVGDILARLSVEQADESARAGWGEILRHPLSPPLAKSFDLKPNVVIRSSLYMVRHGALGISKWAFPFDIRGTEKLPVDRPFLLCPCHCSLIDSVLVYLGLPDAIIDRMFFLGAAEFFESRLMRWLGRIGKVIPTATSDTVLVSLRRAAEALRMGYSVCIFPEGFISRDGGLQQPRPGAGIIACELQVPVVPVLVRGTYEILSYAHPGFRFRPVGLTFGEPIEPPKKQAFESTDYSGVMASWRNAIVRMRKEDDALAGPTAGKSPRV